VRRANHDTRWAIVRRADPQGTTPTTITGTATAASTSANRKEKFIVISTTAATPATRLTWRPVNRPIPNPVANR